MLKIALKKGVRGAISQKAALGILIDIHQINLFIIPVHEALLKFTEMKVTLEMNSVWRGKLHSGDADRGEYIKEWRHFCERAANYFHSLTWPVHISRFPSPVGKEARYI